MRPTQAERLLAVEPELALIPEWSALTAEEQAGTLAKIRALSVEVTPDISGVKKLVARQFDIKGMISDTKAKVVQEGNARRQQVLYPTSLSTPAQEGVREKGQKTVTLPARIGTLAELDALVRTQFLQLVPPLPRHIILDPRLRPRDHPGMTIHSNPISIVDAPFPKEMIGSKQEEWPR